MPRKEPQPPSTTTGVRSMAACARSCIDMGICGGCMCDGKGSMAPNGMDRSKKWLPPMVPIMGVCNDGNVGCPW